MECSRRDFMGLAAGAIASTAFGGCASVALTRVTATDGVIRVPLRQHPRLAEPGGYLKLQTDALATPIYVLAVEGDLVALSPICMHQGCTVNIERSRLVCPCHGSMYDRRGQVLRGPTERALHSYPTTITPEGDVLIRLAREP